jgi:large subunit ribosomal protein L18
VSIEKRLQTQRKRRTFRVRNKLRSVDGRHRVSVFRSLKNISAQVIDDSTHATVASFSSQSLKDVKGDKKAIAKLVGIELGKLVAQKDIKKVYFDRGSCRYHGRVEALAEGLREGGLKF